MEYTRFGKTGMKVSRLCLGCMTYGSSKWREWVLEEEASRPFIREALEKGINFFDTADVYSLGASEEILGRALKDFAKRDEVVIATKVFNPMGPSANARGLSRKHIMEAIDASLRRLGTDYVDLYQIHRFDPETPIEETLEALNDVVRAGKALYIGASSMWAWQFAQMISIARAKRLRRIRLDAELLQSRLSRGRARDDALLRRSDHRRHPLVAARARLSRRRRHRRERLDRARTHRSIQRGAGARIAPGRGDPPAGCRGGREAGHQARGGRARLGAAEAVRHRADRRRVEAASPR